MLKKSTITTNLPIQSLKTPYFTSHFRYLKSSQLESTNPYHNLKHYLLLSTPDNKSKAHRYQLFDFISIHSMNIDQFFKHCRH